MSTTTACCCLQCIWCVVISTAVEKNPDICVCEEQKMAQMENQYRHADRPHNRICLSFLTLLLFMVSLCFSEEEKKITAAWHQVWNSLHSQEHFDSFNSFSASGVFIHKTPFSCVEIYLFFCLFQLLFYLLFLFCVCFPCRDWCRGQPTCGDGHPPWESGLFCAAFRLLSGNFPTAGVHRSGRSCAD